MSHSTTDFLIFLATGAIVTIKVFSKLLDLKLVKTRYFLT
jgi:hypothetical protein